MTVLKAAGITLLAFLLAELFATPFSTSLSSVFSTPEKSDFVLSDFYAQVADRRPVRKLSDKIVIVDIDRADREGIAEILETVSLCGPAAIAIDINFEEAHEDDSRLLRALNAGCPVILPLGLEPADKKKTFKISDRPFFYDSLPGVTYGVVNLPGKYARSSIREFPVKFKMSDGTELPSFVAAVSKEVAPESFARLEERNNEIEFIDYASLEIPVMSLENIYENPEALAGKVVMIGAVNEASDMHTSPVNRSMAGLSIHAYALSTIFQGDYFTGIPKYVDYILASILCFFILIYSLAMKAKIKGLLFRLLQVILIYAVVRIGYELYVSHKIIANFSITLLMVAFGLFALDVWNGTVGLGEFVAKWFRKIKARFKHDII